MARIGLNLIFLVPGETGGMETYARELVRALLSEHPEIEFTAFINREAAAANAWSLTPTVTVPVSATNRIAWVRGEQLMLPRIARKHGIDLLHSLANTAPLWGDSRRVVTIHDLHYKVAPDAHFGLRGIGMSVLVPAAARRSQRIIAVSQNTAHDIVRHLHVSEDKIDVVPNGLGVRPGVAPTVEHSLRERLALGDRQVVLSVSARRPHKNLARLLEALAQIPAERRPLAILPGYPTSYDDQLRSLVTQLGLSDSVCLLGWVSPADLEGLYALADCFVFPSLHEGFGLPLLEAMSRGVPVACSDRSSLGEVAGEAALLFNPENVDAMRSAIETLLGDRELAARLSAAGRKRAQEFTWERCARETIAAYELALS